MGRAVGNRREKRRLCLWSEHIIFEDIRKKEEEKTSSLVFGRSGRDVKRLCEDGRCRGRAVVSRLPPRRESLAVLLPMRLRLPQNHGREAPGLKRRREGRRRRRRGRRRRDKGGKSWRLVTLQRRDAARGGERPAWRHPSPVMCSGGDVERSCVSPSRVNASSGI